MTWFSLYYYYCVSRANAEIAQVRTKAKQEQAAYQASLRKEQMKVDSLERTLEQKVSGGVGCKKIFIQKKKNPFKQVYKL